MDPGGIASKLLTGSIAFTVLVAVFIVAITFLGFSSSMAGGGSKRSFATVIVLFFVAAAILAAALLFPDLPMRAYDFVNGLGYR